MGPVHIFALLYHGAHTQSLTLQWSWAATQHPRMWIWCPGHALEYSHPYLAICSSVTLRETSPGQGRQTQVISVQQMSRCPSGPLQPNLSALVIQTSQRLHARIGTWLFDPGLLYQLWGVIFWKRSHIGPSVRPDPFPPGRANTDLLFDYPSIY